MAAAAALRQGGALRSVGYGAYQRIQAETSSSGQLILMLYDALLKNLKRAETAIDRDDKELAHSALVRSQDIVLELIASLDMDSGEIAHRLAPLYEYQYQRLLDANVHKDGGAVSEVIRLIAPLRQAWAQAIGAEATSRG
jgi:flagellar protein FliS